MDSQRLLRLQKLGRLQSLMKTRIEGRCFSSGRWDAPLWRTRLLSFCSKHGWCHCRSANHLNCDLVASSMQRIYPCIGTLAVLSRKLRPNLHLPCYFRGLLLFSRPSTVFSRFLLTPPSASLHPHSTAQEFLVDLTHEFFVQEGTLPVKPPPSCLSDASVLLAAILRFAQSSAEVERMRIEPLLRVWANLVADWSAWGEHEDEFVFDCVDELIDLQVSWFPKTSIIL